METNIDKVREVSKLLFDAGDVTPYNKEFGEIFISHPYTNSAFVGLNDNGNQRIANIYKNQNDFRKWRRQIFSVIDNSTLDRIWTMLINNPYLLTWLSFVKPYLSREDFSRLLGSIWVQQENPNGDVNVPIHKLIEWFSEADKSHLMHSRDYEVYLNLPDEFEVFRGVSIGRNKNGLSYTRDREKAEWFQKRFETKNKKGTLIHSIIKKTDVLAYFNTRNEDEIVVNSLNIKKEYF